MLLLKKKGKKNKNPCFSPGVQRVLGLCFSSNRGCAFITLALFSLIRA